MAAAVGMSQTAISKIWRAFGLKPHLVEHFKLSPDSRSSSTRCATWLDSIGETHRRQRSSCVLTRRPSRHSTAPPRCCRSMPSVPRRQTHDYVRHGTTNLYAALDVASGHSGHDPATPCPGVQAVPHPHRPQRARRTRGACRVGQRRHAPHRGDPALAPASSPVHVSFHPAIYSSWRTSWSAGRGTHHHGSGAVTASDLIRAVEAWVADWNEHPRPFIWHKTADQIFDNLTGYLNRVNNSGH